jgi:probable phosphomutase (TIGR03848 family)
MTVLLLIRHGVTPATDRGVLSGWTPGIHLSERGREQADRLAERLRGVPIRAIYSSPLERCRETAAPLAAALKGKVATRASLGEVRYGDWTGRPLKQLARTKLWQIVQSVPSRARFPEGESLLEVQERAVREIERIAGSHPKAVVAICTHGDVIRLGLAHYAGVHADLFQRLIVEPASVSVIALGHGVPRILKVNDTGDLASLIPPKADQRKVGG